MEKDKVYLDIFYNEYVLDKIPSSPPERYIEITKSLIDKTIIEKWLGKNDTYLSIAFSEEYYHKFGQEERIWHFKQSNFLPVRLVEYSCPDEEYKKILMRIRLKSEIKKKYKELLNGN